MGRLARRALVPETMDDPGLDRDQHRAALSSLARINRLSGSAGLVWGPIQDLSDQLQESSLRVLDVATGGGDIPIALWNRARQAGVSLQIVGIDKSDLALDYARQQARASNAAVEFQTLDAVSDELPSGFDVSMCSLFLHHLSEEQAEQLLRKMSRCARHLVLVSDLRRCLRGWWLAYAASRLFTSSEVVRTDACLSVSAAFSPEEALALANRAGMNAPRIQRRWPLRFLLTAGSMR